MTNIPKIKILRIFYLVVIASLAGSSCLAGSIVDTKHNLSASGPGDVRALIEDKICVFCHTPHNATPYTPLWNKKIEPKVYTLYESSTLSVIPGDPSGPTRLCLSCHDGTIALGEIVNPPAGTPSSGIIDMTTARLTSGMRSYLGTDISNDHPVSFFYYDAARANPELADTLPPTLHTYGGGNVHCTTCHDPHDNTFGKFLVMSNTYSALCITCHDNKTGWSETTHATDTAVWDPGVAEPSQTVAEHGCGSCHVPHSAEGPKRLLRHLKEEENCYPCHDGTVAATDIKAQFNKTSYHPVAATTIDVTINHHDQADDYNALHTGLRGLQGHVECVDCHNPHAANDTEADPPGPPAASGRLAEVSGINILGAPVDPLTNEYELCFKCHADTGNTIPVIARWIDQNNTRLEFDPGNPSYHPVVATGQNPEVLSLPSANEPLNEESIISCVDCHDNDESSALGNTGPRGPHGSAYRPILRQQYGDTVSYETPVLIENTFVYALCYRCHDRSKLFSNGSFTSNDSGNLHMKHVVDKQVPCYRCHDSHGVQVDGNGDHTHLINFARNVSALGGNPAPYFSDDGLHAGSCTLVCHLENPEIDYVHDPNPPLEEPPIPPTGIYP